MRERLYTIIARAEKGDSVSHAYDLFIMFIAFVSIAPMMFRPQDLSPTGDYVLTIIDIVTAYILLFDYICRWITHDLHRQRYGKSGGWIAFLIYPFTPLAVLDMLSILPTIVPIAESLKFLRLLRLLKIFRISSSLEAVRSVFIHEGRTLLSVFGLTILFVLVSALILYLNEPDTFSSFIDALYWATSSLTTIGYGDFHPLGDPGKLINVLSAVLGISIIALPTGIITAGYVAATQRNASVREKAKERAFDTTHGLAWALRRTLSNFRYVLDRRLFYRYLLEHPLVVKYAVVMLASFLFDMFAMVVVDGLGWEIRLDLVGTATAAALLEPTAGIIVGFFDCLVYAVIDQNPSAILYIIADVCVSIAFGVFFMKERKERRAFGIFSFALLASSFCAVVDCGATRFIDGVNPLTSSYDLAINQVLSAWDVSAIDIASFDIVLFLIADFLIALTLILVLFRIKPMRRLENLLERKKKGFFSTAQREKRERSDFIARQLHWLEQYTLPKPHRSTMRERLYELVNLAEEGDKASSAYNVFLIIVAIISISPVLLQNHIADSGEWTAIGIVDTVCAIILFFDYLLRWMTHDIRRREAGKSDGWFSFALYPLTPLALLDIVSLLPTFLTMGESFAFLRLLRLVKIFRVSRSLVIVCNVFIYESKTLFSVFQITLIYIITTALIMFTNEPGTFESFLDAVYWAATALATIGYGDVSPMTDTGKLINIGTALIGIAVVALPAGIITGGYVTEMRRLKEKGRRKNRLVFLDRSFEEHMFDSIVSVGRLIHPKEACHSVILYFRRRPRITLYTLVILTCSLLSIGEALLWSPSVSEAAIAYGLIGTALAALLLESAAGLIVGFVTCVLYIFTYHSIASIGFFAISALVAILFGSVIPARKPFDLKRYVCVFLAMIILAGIISTVVSLLSGRPLVVAEFSRAGANEAVLIIASLFYRVNSVFYALTIAYPIALIVNKLIVNDPLNLKRHFIWPTMRGDLSRELADAALHATQPPKPAPEEQPRLLSEWETAKETTEDRPPLETEETSGQVAFHG